MDTRVAICGILQFSKNMRKEKLFQVWEQILTEILFSVSNGSFLRIDKETQSAMHKTSNNLRQKTSKILLILGSVTHPC